MARSSFAIATLAWCTAIHILALVTKALCY